MGWQQARLIILEDFCASIDPHLQRLTDLNPFTASTIIAAYDLPIDTVALAYAVFALGMTAMNDLEGGQLYFDVSCEMVKYFVAPPTRQICMSYFLQHVFALRTGTLGFAHGIVAKAVRCAHDLDLHRQSTDTDGLQLYLLIYMADQ